MLTLPAGMQAKIDSHSQTIHGEAQPELKVLLYAPPPPYELSYQVRGGIGAINGVRGFAEDDVFIAQMKSGLHLGLIHWDGEAWSAVPGMNQTAIRLDGPDSEHLWIAAANKAVYRYNGTTCELKKAAVSGSGYLELSAPSEDVCFVAATVYTGGLCYRRVYRTINGGSSWDTILDTQVYPVFPGPGVYPGYSIYPGYPGIGQDVVTIHATSSTFAVLITANFTNVATPLFWDGSAWTAQPLPARPELLDAPVFWGPARISGSGPNHIMGSVLDWTTGISLIFRWDGSWAVDWIYPQFEGSPFPEPIINGIRLATDTTARFPGYGHVCMYGQGKNEVWSYSGGTWTKIFTVERDGYIYDSLGRIDLDPQGDLHIVARGERYWFMKGVPVEGIDFYDWYWTEDESAALGTGTTWNDIASVGKNHIWICSDDGDIFKFNGRSWSKEHGLGEGWSLTSIHAISVDDVWACGWREVEGQLQHIILKRVLSSTTWSVEHTADGRPLTYIWGAATWDIWAWGQYGLRLRRLNGVWGVERADDDGAYHQDEHIRGVGTGVNEVWSVGAGGRVFLFNGLEWNDDDTYFTSPTVDLANLSVLPDGGYVIVSGNTLTGPAVLETNDWGATWNTRDLPTGTTGPARGIVSLGEDTFWLITDDTTLRKRYAGGAIAELAIDALDPTPEQMWVYAPNSAYLVGQDNAQTGVWKLTPPQEVVYDISKYLESGELRLDQENPINQLTLEMNNPEGYLVGEELQLARANGRVEVAFRIGSTDYIDLGSYRIDNVSGGVLDPMVSLSCRGEQLKTLTDSGLEEARMRDDAMPIAELLETLCLDAGLWPDFLNVFHDDASPNSVEMDFARNMDALGAVQEVLLSSPDWRMKERYDRTLAIGPTSGGRHAAWVTQTGGEPLPLVGDYEFERGADVFSRKVELDDENAYGRICVESEPQTIEDELLGHGDAETVEYQAKTAPIIEDSETVTVDGEQKKYWEHYTVNYRKGLVTFRLPPPDTSFSPNQKECHGYEIEIPSTPDANGRGYGCPKLWLLRGMLADGTWVDLDYRSHTGWYGTSSKFEPAVTVDGGCRAYQLQILMTYYHQQDDLGNAYNAATNYSPGKIVSYGGNNYECKTATPAAYDSGTEYSPTDRVSYNGWIYECIATTTGNVPTTYAYWRIVCFRGPGSYTYWVPRPLGKTATRPNIVSLQLYDEEDSPFCPTDMAGYIKDVEVEEDVYQITVSASSEFVYPDGDRRPAWYAFDGSDTRWISNEMGAGSLTIDFGGLITLNKSEVRMTYDVNGYVYKEVPASDYVVVNPLKTLHIPVPASTDLTKMNLIANEAVGIVTNAGKTETFAGPFRPQLIPGDNAVIEPGGLKGLLTTVIHRFGKAGFSTEFTVDSGRRIGKPTIQEMLERAVKRLIAPRR